MQAAAMALTAASGLVDLEKELTCSICTDILHQPLTLLDCLHTFCGACLKEWFSWQRAQNRSSTSPYTCPSCRATVRGTKHNATVNTLLDMFLQVNPGRGKTDEEKKESAENYKHGEDVIPRVRRVAVEGEEEDRRLIDEVRERSLREVGVSGDTLQEPLSRDRRRRERSREHRDADGRSRRHRDSDRPRQTSRSRPADTPPRQIEHQSSLRSLLSVPEFDSREMQEEIMRQIVEEGLLDGIDLNNIDVSQEDEISERIAQAYRRRLEDRRTERHRRRAAAEAQSNATESSRPSSSAREEERSSSRRQRERSDASTTLSRPPVSRPHLFEAMNNNQGPRRHRRSSSQDSSAVPSSRGTVSAGVATTQSNAAARSATDLSERPSSSLTVQTERRRRLSHNDRSTTDPDRHNIREQWRNAGSNTTLSTSNPVSPRRAAFTISESPQTQSPQTATVAEAMAPPTSRRNTDTNTTRAPRPANIRSSPRIGTESAEPSPTVPPPQGQPPPSIRSSQPVQPVMYPEPNISCNQCGTTHIEYDLHYNCSRCESGNYNVCLRCYRRGKGCLHWYGLGHAARARYEQMAPPGGYPPDHEPPHTLVGHRYERLGSEATHVSSNTRQVLTNQDPAKRLQAGVFCDICLTFANRCYWKCDTCNEGAWGFCNTCVNQSRHCTHPLIPLSTENPSESASSPPQLRDDQSLTTPIRLASPPATPKSASIIRGPAFTLANTLFYPLTFAADCDICGFSIPPSHTRFHCPRCNAGDFDICTPCYHGLVSSGHISAENGHQGWRRCPTGHRMVIVGFEDRDGGQRRVVERDLVGGLALKDEDGGDSQAARTTGANADVAVTPNWSWRDTDGAVRKARTAHAGKSVAGGSVAGLRFPPDGGLGLRVVALWGYFPSEGVKDELMFPKGAEIREAEDINGDWFWGVYAGGKGLFPGGYGRVI